MRRFSQRNSLVTLNDINITPLLDLAFVLLIIFVITTPILEQALPLSLPQGGTVNRKIKRDDLATAEVDARGRYALNGKILGSYEQLEAALVKLKQTKPGLVVNIRASGDGAYKFPFAIMNLCQRLRVGISLAAEPNPGRTR